jgi:DNA-directed RNA polymerase subunit RPC12/RpoP
MAITIERDGSLHRPAEEQFGLECPYCGVYARMSPQSVPNFEGLTNTRPKNIGLVYQCDACSSPVFLKFSVKKFNDDSVELYRNFVELERPKERFQFSYLPNQTDILFREALACYTNHSFNAFASMCRRAAASSFVTLGESGKLRAFDEVMAAQEIAEIDDDDFEPIKQVIFGGSDADDLPVLDRAQAGILLEVLKDMFYQCFVRHGKLSRAIKVRRFFVEDGHELKSSA